MRHLLLLCLVLAPLPAAAQNRPAATPQPPPAPDTTGVPSCNEQVRDWRACIAVSNKSEPEKATAYAEVNRFINDVRNATGQNRAGLARACAPASAGYRRMLAEGTCARGQTGLYDDLRQTNTPAPAIRR